MNDNSNMPLVSCCILSYNNTHFLPEVIETVSEQDYPNIEIIICDDCSKTFPNDITTLLDKTGREYLIIRNEMNQGTVRNINNGCKAAKGKIILTLAADDLLNGNTVISEVVRVQKLTGDEMFACRRQLCEKETMEPIALIPTDKEIELITKMDNPEKQFVALATRQFYHMASGSCMCYTKALLEQVGYFDEDYMLVEDAPFLLKYLQQGKMIKTHYDIVSIKYRDGGISNSGIPRNSKIFKDGTLMYTKDILPFVDSLDQKTKRLVKAIFEFRMAENMSDKVGLMVKKPNLLVWKIRSKLIERIVR